MEKDDGILSHLKVKPTIVTPDNISTFTIQDVVLPLPGYAVTFPDNKGKV